MKKSEIEKRVKVLQQTIKHHNHQYHVLDQPEISDAEYDALLRELEGYEKEYPEFFNDDFVSHDVGGKVLSGFEKFTHKTRMLSLEDAFSLEDVHDWYARMRKIIPDDEITFYVEYKIDGLAISLHYQDGDLVYAVTRGDGEVGELVTENIKMIQSIPQKISLMGDVEVRGEVYLTKENFHAINKKQEENGEKTYANPRNLAAGSIRQLNTNLVKQRNLSFYAYDIVSGVHAPTHEKVHKILDENAFEISPRSKVCDSIDEVFSFYNDVNENRESLPFEIDGLVIQVNQEHLHEKLGVVGKYPRYAVAFKFPAEKTVTVLEDIHIQVGRTGALTPVAHLRPVLLAGSTISRATLHNIDEIKRLEIKIGDTVVLHKAGDVIPAIIGVKKELRTGNEVDFEMPDHCPICDGTVFRDEKESAYYCKNENCFAQEVQKIIHFVSRRAFNIEGFGDKIVEQLMKEGLITYPHDIFSLTKGDLSSLERFGEKSAQNLINSINKSKEISVQKFIYAHGIRYIGYISARLLGRFAQDNNFGQSVLDLYNFFSQQTKENFLEIDGVGEKVAQSLVEFFAHERSHIVFEELNRVGIILLREQKTTNNFFLGKTFLMTGSFEKYKRDQVYEIIQNAGGNISSTVNKSLDYLIVGQKAGSKLKKAQDLGITILNEKDFLDTIS